MSNVLGKSWEPAVSVSMSVTVSLPKMAILPKTGLSDHIALYAHIMVDENQRDNARCPQGLEGEAQSCSAKKFATIKS